MKNPLVIGVAIGVAVIALAVTGVVYMQWGAHVEVKGQFLKVRTAPLDEHSAAAVVDFRLTNPSDYAFVVNSVTLVLEDAAGKSYEGSTVSEADTPILFGGVPLLGHKYNPSLIVRDKIVPRQVEDRMVAARFEVPESMLEKRKRFVIRVAEVDGGISEIHER